MNAPHRRIALAFALAAGTTTAQFVSVPGDVVVDAGDTLIISSDTIYTGSLTINAGAQVVVDAGLEIRIANGAALTVNGTAAEPVEFFPINNTWDGLRFLDGSTAEMNFVDVTGILATAIVIDDAEVSMTGVSIFDNLPSLQQPAFTGTRTIVRANNGAVLEMDECFIGPWSGRRGNSGNNGSSPAGTGTNGFDGFDIIGIDAQAAERIVITDTLFTGLSAGRGGSGGRGGNGSPGENAPNAVLGNGIQGGMGGTGGRGGNAGDGGDTIVVRLSNVDDAVIAQNVFDFPRAALGGVGGRGGTGGVGGRGGRGADGVFGNGARGGKGGTGGNGGRGGDAGDAGTLTVFDVNTDTVAPRIVNNTVYNAEARDAVPAGSNGPGGPGGAGGAGGAAGIGGSTGAFGSGGDIGTNGPAGGAGAAGPARVIRTLGADIEGFSAYVTNNIITLIGTGSRLPFVASDAGIIDATTNLVDNASTIATGPVFGVTSIIDADPLLIDPNSDSFAPAPSSPAIDAGDNTAVPAELATDFLGNPRVADTLGNGFTIDLGAIEAPGEVPDTGDCPADINGDGIADGSDFFAWVNAFGSQAPECDVNGDGSCNGSDFFAWVTAFGEGCP